MLGAMNARQKQSELETEALLQGQYRHIPGQSWAVNFVVVDEVHVLQHAQDGL